jgi:hypothetical protein
MIIKPKNKWIQVSLDFDKVEKIDTLIALPEDYKPAEKPYKAVSVQADPEDEYKLGDVVVVPTHIVREVELEDNKFYLIERGHIMVRVEE